MVEKQLTPKKMLVPRALKNLVIDSIKRHAWNIGVSQYRGEILWMEKDNNETDRGGTIHAEVTVDRRYLTATFKIYPIVIENWKKEGPQAVERIIAHEVAHLATQHFYDVATATLL